MENTMADLREEVASRLRNALHGREIDMMERHVGLPHMLGITPIGKFHDPQVEEMTLLDTEHPFWQNYHKEVDGPDQAAQEIQTAIRSLKVDDVFRMTYPYGEEAEVVYIEVDKLNRNRGMTTDCHKCGETIDLDVNVPNDDLGYYFQAVIDCPHCGYYGEYEQRLING